MPVLTAIDGEESPSRTVEVAKELADAFEEELVALHVMPKAEFDSIRNRPGERTIYPIGDEVFFPPAAEAGGSDSSEARKYTIDDGEEHARRVAKEVVQDTLESVEAVAYQGRVGDPTTKIVAEANRRKARYIVIGGRKRSPVGKAVFGSITQSILLNADSTVVTVPEDSSEENAGGPVVAAVDGSDRGQTVLRTAADLADRRGLELHVVNAQPESSDADEGGDGPEAVAHGVIEAAASSIDRSYEAVALVGSPGEQIVEYAAEVGASYIVTSGRKRSPVGKVLFGSVTQAVMLRADCPVVTTMQ